MNKYLFKNLIRRSLNKPLSKPNLIKRSFSHSHLKKVSIFSDSVFSNEKNENTHEKNKYLINQYKLKYVDEVYYNSMKSFGLFGSSSILGSIFINNVNIGVGGMLIYGGLFGYSIYSIFNVTKIKSEIVEKEKGVYEELSNDVKNNYLKKTMISLGLINAPFISIINEIDPLILPSALIVSLGTSGSLCLLAKNLDKKNINLIKFQAPLVASLWGLIGISILDIIGYSPFSLSTNSLIGIGVFSMLTVVDMQIMLKSYDEKQLDKYGHTLNMTLNLINLFQKISLLLADQKMKK